MPHWTPEEMPDLTGRVAMVTGASSGIGFQTALELARHGARTLLAVRDPEKGESARERIATVIPSARGLVEVVHVDLASLDSIEDAAADLADRTAAVDILVNNAGVMVPDGSTTADGFELQFGTNHLGHFALTGRLLPLLLAAESARVVTVSSLTHRRARPIWDFEPATDNAKEFYTEAEWHRHRVSAYGRSKLANLLFTRELDRKAKHARVSLASVAAHPGYAATGLFVKTSFSRHHRVVSGLSNLVTRATGQSAATGAWPSLYAATHVDLFGGEYIGPRGPGEMRGAPALAAMSLIAQDESVAAVLWDQSVAATGVGYEELSR
ncbi:NAD(P)-dependent dehydrogenase (short-subunit alcohol dehydrogenase family) [Catenulispora sp. EB89]|uniref:oxidoreductase n=1 Tax=Catenulispora sp. EB89 TaxID=3156257 RepID=UPI003512F5FD